ncbi:uncharacterized protein LOC141656335 isoform X2 [Silene latifolia]|uniref:uncharacterized protein LOC141656335 isoform X2 n=1 Tax=Silene latifolia TaxID=37657 RepID=UPI003D772C77
MTKKKNRHFSTTHHHHHHPPHPPPQSHHYLHHLPPPPPPHHPLHHHHHHQPIHQAQPNYPPYETTLIQEVLYLHSLWHRGPPSGPTTRTNQYLKPTPTTHFKKNKHVSDKEWPVSEVVPDPHSGSEWPAFRKLNTPITRPATEEEKARVLGVRVQMRGVEACSCLFQKRNEDGEDEEDDEEEEDDGDDEEEIDLFENLFEEDGELREFYKKNCEGVGGGGEFCCLVCGGGNVGRKFKNCVALVQHSITVSKTKRRKAHRAYGRVVCKVLGWDVDRLPSLPVSVGDGVGVGGSESVGKSSEVMKGEVKNDADGGSVGVEMERNGASAEPSQTEMETIPDALETENVTSTGVGHTAVELTPGLGEVKNDADGGSADVEMERNAALAEPSQTETETIPDALETENVTSAGGGCTAAELTPGLSDVKSHGDQDSAVEMERDASLAKLNQTGMETTPDSLEKENVTSTDGGCIAKELAHDSGRFWH